MAIKIGGNTVIDDSKNLTNIVNISASGTLAFGSTPSAGTSGQVLTSGGSGAAPSWQTPASNTTLTIANKTGAYTVVAGDAGKVINCTSGTFTVALTAAATLGAGFNVTIWNSGIGAITIDPNASETISLFDTWILANGEGLTIVCDGANWQVYNERPHIFYDEKSESGTSSRAVATAREAIAIGSGAAASGINAIALGTNSSASSNSSTAIGGASVSGLGALAIGYQANANGNIDYANAIGFNAYARGGNSIALGNSYTSGTDSFAAVIANNTSSYGATGANSIAIGNQSKTAGYSISIGTNYTGGSLSSGTGSITLGSGGITASGDYSKVIGEYSTASGISSIVIGKTGKASQYGKYAYSSGSFIADYNIAGDAQYGKLVIRAATTTSTAVVLTSDGAAASTTNQLVVASGQAMTFTGMLIAKQSASANMSSYTFKGAIVNNGGTVSISTISVETIIDTIGLTTQPTFTADNTNKALAVTSGAKSATNIRWVANIDSVEVTYS